MTDRTGRCRLLAGALLVANLPLAPAWAQDRDLDREPVAGKVFRGELAEGQDAPARFLLTLRGGQAVELTAAQVGGSDPYLRVFDAASGELIAENDDSAGSLAASARLYSEDDKRVRIEVTNGAVEEASGPMRFDLILRPSDYRPVPPRDIAPGKTLTGILAGGDQHLFRFHAERGQLWTIAMKQAEGSDLDPTLEVFSGNSPSGDSLASDDDGGGGLDARIRFPVPRTGDYVVRASGVGTSEGAYALTAGNSASSMAPVQEVELGRAVTGTLGDTPERFFRLGQATRAALAGGSGPLKIELRHTGGGGEGELDPIVDVGFETPLGFSSVLSDDDGAGGTDARVLLDVSTFNPAWLESLRIRASAYSGTSGGYELLVTAQAD